MAWLRNAAKLASARAVRYHLSSKRNGGWDVRFSFIFPVFFCFACANVQETGGTPRDDAAAYGPRFICTGTEPFWSLELTPAMAILSHVGMSAEPDRTEYAGGWTDIDDDEGVYAWLGAGESEGAFDVVIRREQCQGTRDEPYEYQSSYGTGRPNGVFEPGCCRRMLP